MDGYLKRKMIFGISHNIRNPRGSNVYYYPC
nr:MAG TPA_asm: histidine kinase-like protein [Caudoviricetes sp.]